MSTSDSQLVFLTFNNSFLKLFAFLLVGGAPEEDPVL